MKKTLLVQLPGDDEPTRVSYHARSRQVVIVGADSELGSALALAMAAIGFHILGLGDAPTHDLVSCPRPENAPSPAACAPQHVTMPAPATRPSPAACAPQHVTTPAPATRPSPATSGQVSYSQTDYASFAIPDDCNLVLYCHDATRSPDRHLTALDTLCRTLAATRTGMNQIHVALFTPATACQTSARIRENAALQPHSHHDLLHAQAELLLHAWCFRSRTAILPNLFRHGELYGLSTGHIAASLRHARSGHPLQLPGLGNQKRTLTHLDDLAAAVATLLKDDFTPSPINLPGETLTVIDYLLPIADRFGVDLDMTPDSYSDDLPWGIGDCVLSAALFKSEAPTFRLRHRFRSWLASLADAF